jgi:hypothetical protein
MRTLRKPFEHTQALVINEVREQVQEDIIIYIEATGGNEESDVMVARLCQIVVENFKRLKD